MEIILKIIFISLQILAIKCYTARVKPVPVDINETWTGKWFPQKPDFLNVPFKIPGQISQEEVSIDTEVKLVSSSCDDGQSNLVIDWNGEPSDYICTLQKDAFLPNFSKPPTLELVGVPKVYRPAHECMNVTIVYDEDIPTFGNHRMLWPKYGEYQYLPRQRWLHTLEHGGIVMLYHPCANLHQVNKLRKLVRNCLHRHVITPSNFLPPELPMALISWGKKLQMSFVDPDVVRDFIKANALKGPEQISSNGQFSYSLTTASVIVSDEFDTILCPKYL